MALVVCNKASHCIERGCPWHEPRQEVELGSAHCNKWEHQTGLSGHNITIVAASTLDNSDPNLIFARKKHGF